MPAGTLQKAPAALSWLWTGWGAYHLQRTSSVSWQPGQDPIPGDKHSCDAIEHVIVPRARDLGGFEVRRALPSAQKQMVGPFIFFDQMGPAEFLIGNGIDVRPHPHIGLATVTYLFEGEVLHRDSLGTAAADPPRRGQPDDGGPRHRAFRARDQRGQRRHRRPRPGARRRARRRDRPSSACSASRPGRRCPRRTRRQAPAFAHHGSDELPRIAGEGKRVRLVMGSAYGARSPVELPARERCSPRRCWRRARCCRSIPTTTSAPSMSPRARSTSPATGSARAGCWCSSRATASRSWPSRSRG